MGSAAAPAERRSQAETAHRSRTKRKEALAHNSRRLQRDLVNYDPDAPDRPRTGGDLPHLVRSINELLTERRRTPLIPCFNDRWSLERRNQMLQLAVNEFTWDH